MDFLPKSLSEKNSFIISWISCLGSSTSSQSARINSPMQLHAELITKFSDFLFAASLFKKSTTACKIKDWNGWFLFVKFAR